MTVKIGSLFSGYGGLDIGVQSVVDSEVAWVSDIDKGANAILAHHHPDVPNLGDISTVDWSEVEPVDILTGGFPCQDLSHAGGRAGIVQGTRSGLWFEMARAIDGLRPQLVVVENVRGLLSAKSAHSEEVVTIGPRGGRKVGHSDRALGVVLSDLADLGYDAQWYGLRAADVGAAHGRFRVFLFAVPADSDLSGLEGFADQARAAQAGRRGHAEPGAGGPDLTLLPTPAVNDMGASYTPETWDAWTAKMQAAHGNGNGHGKSLAIEAQRLLPTPEAADGSGGRKSAEFGGHRESGAKRAVTLATAIDHRWGDYAAAIARWEHVIGRPAPDPTEPGAKGNPRLSPRFVEFLMGLPAGHVTDPAIGLTRNQALKALGNGVVPQQAAAATQAFIEDIAREDTA